MTRPLLSPAIANFDDIVRIQSNFHPAALFPKKIQVQVQVQSFSSSSSSENENEENKENAVIYEGPFASLSLRLKRISVTTAIASMSGIPILLYLQASGSSAGILNDIPAVGQLAVGGTAIAAATGSTAALTFCFGPYIESLEWVTVNVDVDKNKDGESEKREIMLKATTRNMFSMKVETLFDPYRNSSNIGIGGGEDNKDGGKEGEVHVVHNPTSYRPFCNFEAKGKPFYVHPELIYDEHLRYALVGYPVKNEEDDDTIDDSEEGKKKKKQRRDPDDEFL